MSETTTGEVVLNLEGPGERAELTAVAGFLAGYCGTTRTSYATDLRIFTAWCRQCSLTLTVYRAHLELFGRWMEQTGRIRSTVGRRLGPSMATSALGMDLCRFDGGHADILLTSWEVELPHQGWSGGRTPDRLARNPEDTLVQTTSGLRPRRSRTPDL